MKLFHITLGALLAIAPVAANAASTTPLKNSTKTVVANTSAAQLGKAPQTTGQDIPSAAEPAQPVLFTANGAAQMYTDIMNDVYTYVNTQMDGLKVTGGGANFDLTASVQDMINDSLIQNIKTASWNDIKAGLPSTSTLEPVFSDK